MADKYWERQPTPEDEDIVIEQMSEPKGLFGVKGNLRNILGTIGDAFLIQGGADPIYAPKRQAERESRALFDMADDPMNAVKKLARAGNPKAARELYSKIMEEQRLTSKEAREAAIAKGKYGDEVMANASALLGTLRNSKTPEAIYPAIRKRVVDYFAKRGVEAPYELPETYDANTIENIFMSGVPAKDQIVQGNLLDYRNRRLDQMDRGLDIREEGQDNTQEYRGKRLDQIDKKLRNDEYYRGRRLEQFDMGIDLNKNPPPKPDGKSSPDVPPNPPRKPNDRITKGNKIVSSSDGKVWDYISTDGGKTWKRQ